MTKPHVYTWKRNVRSGGGIQSGTFEDRETSVARTENTGIETWWRMKSEKWVFVGCMRILGFILDMVKTVVMFAALE